MAPPLHVHLSPNSGTPIYRQIADEVRSAWLRGALKPGEKLPSVRDLAATLGVNPTTVVKAYDALAAERLITKRQGQGVFLDPRASGAPDTETEDELTVLARKLAIEGRRAGWTETELKKLLGDQLRELRPERKRS